MKRGAGAWAGNVAVTVIAGSVLTPGAATADMILPVGHNGVTYIRTESGRTMCGVEGAAVLCTVQFVDPPLTAANGWIVEAFSDGTRFTNTRPVSLSGSVSSAPTH